jgi:hypothetical protein
MENFIIVLLHPANLLRTKTIVLGSPDTLLAYEDKK